MHGFLIPSYIIPKRSVFIQNTEENEGRRTDKKDVSPRHLQSQPKKAQLKSHFHHIE